MHIPLIKGLFTGVIIIGTVGDLPPADTSLRNAIEIAVQNNLPKKKDYVIVDIFLGPIDEVGGWHLETVSQQLPDDGLAPGEGALIRAEFTQCQNRVMIILDNGENYYSMLDICDRNPTIILNTD